MTDRFSAIRPYADSEVAAAVARLLSDQEFLRSLARWQFPRLSGLFPCFLTALAKHAARRELGQVNSVYAVQTVVKRYVDRIVEQTVDGFSITGLEALEPNTPYLFLGNHRDITLDPALMSWVLFNHHFATPRLAIGDNLLSKPYVFEAMRLNKSFIVNRSAQSKREQYRALQQLSDYIYHSLLDEQESIWMAHRQGRAKNGLDRTETAVIKMLALVKAKTETFADYIKRLRIVPVSISYEWDPCDEAKARELWTLQKEGRYQKSEHEDVATIAAGIAGHKGAVHVHFSAPLTGHYEDAQTVAAALDQAIIRHYTLYPNSLIAYELVHGEPFPLDELDAPNRLIHQPWLVQLAQMSIDERTRYLAAQREILQQRLSNMPPELHSLVLTMYANPALSLLAYCKTDSASTL